LIFKTGGDTTAQGNYKYAVMAVEYFTKHIEANPLVNIAVVGLKRFFWQNIIYHFRVPRKLTVDNAKQFDFHIFKDFCHQMGVETGCDTTAQGNYMYAVVVVEYFTKRIEAKPLVNITIVGLKRFF
jgi:hypothetical protein